MEVVLIFLAISLFLICIKNLIDINLLALRVSKNKELNKQNNDLDQNYQFIRGLY